MSPRFGTITLTPWGIFGLSQSLEEAEHHNPTVEKKQRVSQDEDRSEE